MTIESTTSKILYDGTGAQVAFPYTFRIFSTDEAVVTLRGVDGTETPLSLDTDFVITGIGNVSGGTVTLIGDYAVGGDHGPPSVDEKLLIKRVVPLKQEADYTEGGPFLAESHEDALDRVVCMTQQLQEQLGRAVLMKETVAPDEVFNASEFLKEVSDTRQATAASADMASWAAQQANASKTASAASAESAQSSAEAAETARDIAIENNGRVLADASDENPSALIYKLIKGLGINITAKEIDVIEGSPRFRYIEVAIGAHDHTGDAQGGAIPRIYSGTTDPVAGTYPTGSIYIKHY